MLGWHYSCPHQLIYPSPLSPQKLHKTQPRCQLSKKFTETTEMWWCQGSCDVRGQPAKICDTCRDSVCMPNDAPQQDREAFLQIKSKGGLLRPSEELYNVIRQVMQRSEPCSETIITSSTLTYLTFVLVGWKWCSQSVSHIGARDKYTLQCGRQPVVVPRGPDWAIWLWRAQESINHCSNHILFDG